MTRRDWGKAAVGGLAATVLPLNRVLGAKKINSTFSGVLLGSQSYSFRDRPLDELIKGMVAVGLGSCELWQGHVEPRELSAKQYSSKDAREELRKWRLTTPLSEFRAIGNKFAAAGIELFAYNLSFREDFTDEEIDRGFQMARAMGAKAMTASSTVPTAKRVDGFARRYRMRVGMHNHSDLRNPNEFATPDSFARALEGASPYLAINLDIGHFTAANFDAVDFMKKHHDRIVSIHVKDRKKNQGDNVPFGTGDTPIKDVLTLMKANRWKFPANLEYEYRGTDTIAEMKACLDYCKSALGA
jgi:sugar phosphate isomerase/epimerase